MQMVTPENKIYISLNQGSPFYFLRINIRNLNIKTMKNLIKLGFVALALSVSLSSCDFFKGSASTPATDSLKNDSLTIDSLKQDTSTINKTVIKVDSSEVMPQKK